MGIFYTRITQCYRFQCWYEAYWYYEELYFIYHFDWFYFVFVIIIDQHIWFHDTVETVHVAFLYISIVFPTINCRSALSLMNHAVPYSSIPWILGAYFVMLDACIKILLCQNTVCISYGTLCYGTNLLNHFSVKLNVFFWLNLQFGVWLGWLDLP